MTDVLVSSLRLRTSPDHAVRTRVRVEDALRLADPDDRLLVCRRLDLGRMPNHASQADWAERSAARVGELRARAVHATWPNAADRDAVWFHSAEEARALLLRELAAGRTPSAWFWRLAVRDWGGAPLAAWLPRLLVQAANDPVVLVSVARAVAAAAASGQLAGIAAALAHISETAMEVRPAAFGTAEAARTAAERAATLTRARRLIARLDAAAIPAITRVLADVTTPPSTRAAIVRLALIAAEPALATQAAELAAMVSELIAEAEAAARAEPAERSDPSRRDPDRTAGTPEPAGAEVMGMPPTDGTAATRTAPDARIDRAEPRLAPHHATPEEPASPTVTTQERHSRSAGLFLVIRPLIMMGFPEWVQARPDRMDARFPRLLLHAIATRMRAPADDPVFAAIGLEPADLDAVSAPPMADDLTTWRVGLDRWLRRTARIRLVDVATRPGWILNADEHLRMRYRLDDADIRLRRHALDLDPGWVAWLGQVVHYHYSDQKLT